VAFGGGLLMALGPKGDKEEGTVSLAGDLAALLSATSIIGYLLVRPLPAAGSHVLRLIDACGGAAAADLLSKCAAYLRGPQAFSQHFGHSRI
jgi:hypothetical protein